MLESQNAPGSVCAKPFFRRWLVLLATLPAAAALAAGSASFRPVDLRCEYLRNPLGIGTSQPRLSWVLQPYDPEHVRDQRQSAFQILVAATRLQLESDQGDLWDSGKINSDQSILVRYHGRPLTSAQECFWKLRVWDQAGKVSDWSEPARWTMGLLTPSDWKASWIGEDGAESSSAFTGASWIWFPEGHPEETAPIAARYFRRVFELPADRFLKSARWLVAADNEVSAFVNGQLAGNAIGPQAVSEFSVLRNLHPGKNVLAASVRNMGETPNPAGFVGLLEVEFQSGPPLLIPTDETWQTCAEKFADWQQRGYNASNWVTALKLGPVGMKPWGEVMGPDNRRLPARWLRKEFSVEKRLRRALVFASGLGLSEFYLNGQKVGNEVLSPGLTDYSKRILYVVHDVTSQIRSGSNAVGAVLGNGRFFAPRTLIPMKTRTYGFPKLLFQMLLEFEDGSRTVIASDNTWRITTNGPICANNEYDGEEYDARLEMDHWSEVGFDDSQWRPAQLVPPPAGVLAPQMIEPIRVTQTLAPVALTQPAPGVYVFDFGQNIVGWCRLHVSGPRGATVTLRHAETLQPDGSLFTENLRSAEATDTYIAKGRGEEVYEPRFTSHGFRFVELTGSPGVPKLSSLEARVVHDDLESAGDFLCSNPLLNKIYQNVSWSVRGNYRSIPTDCPQRDERQGWLGDRATEAKGETFLFNTAAFYSKWLQDIDDAQKENGSVPDVCPPYWPIYNDNVTWPSCAVIIPGELLDQYGDTGVVARHYDAAKKWLDYMSGYLTNGLISRDDYGDWCVPGETPFVHSQNPKHQTGAALLATAYFYEDALLMSRYARLLGQNADARHFDFLADTCKAAFNRSFFKPALEQYDNGSQTSFVLPLAFGLAPAKQANGLFAHLLNDVLNQTHEHVGTGLLGCQWLTGVLSKYGRPDVAYRLATQKTYPSWGQMAEQGATTIWERWNGATADADMNSRNQVALVGDLCTWLHETLAGIKSDPDRPGFKHIVMRPEPVGDLTFVHATHRSPYGLIASSWEKDASGFHWSVTIPVNDSATIYVPATSAKAVKENGQPPRRSRGIKSLGMQGGRAVFIVGSGSYHFDSTPSD